VKQREFFFTFAEGWRRKLKWFLFTTATLIFIFMLFFLPSKISFARPNFCSPPSQVRNKWRKHVRNAHSFMTETFIEYSNRRGKKSFYRFFSDRAVLSIKFLHSCVYSFSSTEASCDECQIDFCVLKLFITGYDNGILRKREIKSEWEVNANDLIFTAWRRQKAPKVTRKNILTRKTQRRKSNAKD
jgi:hypothetical protein